MLINAIAANYQTSASTTTTTTTIQNRRTPCLNENVFDFVKTAKSETKKLNSNSTANSNTSAPMRSASVALLSPLKEAGCDSATPSLQQQMNLARRACWCNEPSQKVLSRVTRCKNCCNATTNAADISSNNNNTTITATTTMIAANNAEDVDAAADAVEDAGKSADIDEVDDYDNANDEDDVTTVLNGATFSKNIENLISNVDKSNCIFNNGKTNANTNYVNDIAENDNDNDEIDNGDDSDNVDTLTDKSTTATTTNLSKNNLIRRNNKTKPTTTTTTPAEKPISTKTTTTANCAALDNNVNMSSKAEAEIADCTLNTTTTTKVITAESSPNAAALRAFLLRFWLAFVAFCDKMTIKPDDPRFAEARRRDQQRREQQQQPPGNTTTNNNNSSDNNNKSTKPTAAAAGKKFKLLTSKKLLLVFLVCVFFSCIHRIEGRPNRSSTVITNAISGDDITDGDAPITESLNNIVAARLAAPADSEDNTLPPTLEEKPKADEVPIDDAPLSTHDEEDEELHHLERYPVAQVDFDRVKTPFIIGIWILSASIAKIGFHMTPKLHLIFPESCLLIVVGVVIGFVLYFGTEVAVSPLTPNTFFFYMLPPIILDAGYFMPNRLFFDNLGTILLMAVIGTIFNIATIGLSLWGIGLTGLYGGADQTPKFLDTFLFASLISAVDPVAVLAVFEEIHVNEILYIVVFGESLLNDAVTVVMYHMMEAYNEIGISNIIPQDIVSGVGSFFVVAIGGTLIGIIWGFLTGLVTRFTDHVRVIEPIFIFVMAYLAYLNAEIFHMSGILAITFCGITMKNYVESNISQKSHTTVKYALKMISSSSETIIFMFLGVATVKNNHVWNTWFVFLTITFCSVYRVVGVIILTAIANRFRLHKLSRVDQFVMSYGGLRGAVAFALALLIDERVVKQKEMFVTTTIAVIYFTVFVQGITIKPLVKFLNVKRANKRKPTMNERIHERFMDHLMAGIEDIVGKTGNYNVRDKFKRFDNRFIRPLLIRDLKQGAEPKIIETYSKLTMRDAMEVMRRNPSTIGQITATESMSALFRNYTNNCIGGSPSLTNLDNTCSRNLDMHELDYNPSKKDLTDARIHHLLAEELKPYRRHRRLSYSRHAVDDRDLSTQVNYKMQMNFRRMFNDRKHHKRSKRGASKQQQQEGVKQNHVSFHDFQQNGSTKQFSHDYINDVLNESAEDNQPKLNEVTVAGANEDWDDGLTFTAKSSPDSDRANNNSLIAHIQNLPGFDASKARIVQHYTQKSANSTPEKLLTPDVGPTAAELILPWRRDRSYQSIVAEQPIPEEDRNALDGERRVATPTATESQLPWKRQGDEISDAVQQNEFPAWASNKEYLAYNSPSATFLGGINKPKQPKSVIGLFRRESSGSKGGSSIVGVEFALDGSGGSDPALVAALNNIPPPVTPVSRMNKRSQSVSAGSGVGVNVGEGHAGPFPVTASHRRNVRRGSMLELSGDTIPEETYQHGHSKSLCEPAGDEWDDSALSSGAERASASAHSERLLRGSGREPLLPRLTPRAQIRRMGAGVGGGGSKSQVTTALLSTSNSDYDDDEDEDFDLYDDENIVVTTTSTGASAGVAGAGRGRGEAAGGSNTPTTTTTIRLTRNNDESII